MKRVICIVFVLAFTASLGWSQGRINLNYKARLTDPNGTPIRTATSAQFAICLGGDPAAIGACGGGAVSYNETATVNPDGNGVFEYLIGTGTHAPPDLDLVLFNTAQPLYLEVTINGETLLPRKPLTLNQDTAASNSFLMDSMATADTRGVISTGNVFVTGNVGVGTTNPSGKLHAVGGDRGLVGSCTNGGCAGVVGDTYTGWAGVLGYAGATSGNSSGVIGYTASSNGFGGY